MQGLSTNCWAGGARAVLARGCTRPRWERLAMQRRVALKVLDSTGHERDLLGTKRLVKERECWRGRSSPALSGHI